MNVVLKASVEFVCWGGGVCTVICMSNPTAVLRLCCVVVGVVTTVNIDSFIFVQDEDLVFAMLYECRRSCRVNYREIKRWMILDSF